MIHDPWMVHTCTPPVNQQENCTTPRIENSNLPYSIKLINNARKSVPDVSDQVKPDEAFRKRY
jgi:hypothetical protein